MSNPGTSTTPQYLLSLSASSIRVSASRRNAVTNLQHIHDLRCAAPVSGGRIVAIVLRGAQRRGTCGTTPTAAKSTTTINPMTIFFHTVLPPEYRTHVTAVRPALREAPESTITGQAETIGSATLPVELA